MSGCGALVFEGHRPIVSLGHLDFVVFTAWLLILTSSLIHTTESTDCVATQPLPPLHLAVSRSIHFFLSQRAQDFLFEAFGLYVHGLAKHLAQLLISLLQLANNLVKSLVLLQDL